ncbi:alpha/beta hydrolase [Clostridium sp. Marseille-P3244]|uniref:alpha/beta hydrolase n=1 Tax=Clostridium sp. Marseille-P3244 TaxID=1871020 RepID=UPI000AAA75C7|nr:alpha/beta hydrolase [Clostridium sp. Marseille-P3244]
MDGQRKTGESMKSVFLILAVFLSAIFLLSGCGGQTAERTPSGASGQETESTGNVDEEMTDMENTGSAQEYTPDTRVVDVINDPVFGDHGRLIFPADRSIDGNLELKDVGRILTWYNNVNPERTVGIANYLKDQASAGEQIFYDIYTDEEKAEDPDKEDTGLFFFRGDPGQKTAVVNAGGGFVYVAAMHDSFPQALELSRRGYNAFALIYRPGADTACEDLARAIAFLHEHAEELKIDMTDYSLWGGSAGARMAAWLGSYGTESFGEREYPAPAAVIMQYTGLSDVTGNEPPTYACVGTSDGIASWQSMERYVSRIRDNGTDAEIEVFDGLRHGFGLGEGTVAEGWIDHAVSFWERNMK